MAIFQFGDDAPRIAPTAWVAESAQVIGRVELAADASVWYGCVLRGDIHAIEIGEGTNIQDLTVVHLADDYGVKVGRYCTIGHGAIVGAAAVHASRQRAPKTVRRNSSGVTSAGLMATRAGVLPAISSPGAVSNITLPI